LSSTLYEWGQLTRLASATNFAQPFSDSVKYGFRKLYNLAEEGLNHTASIDKYAAELTSCVRSIRQELEIGTIDSEETWVSDSVEGKDENGEYQPLREW